MDELLKRISIDSKVLVGKPVIHGTRLSVEYILGLLAQGWTLDDILSEYDGISREDVQACLLFASKSLQNVDFLPLSLEG
jgi:uncharacterized protein (DUF433 family)